MHGGAAASAVQHAGRVLPALREPGSVPFWRCAQSSRACRQPPLPPPCPAGHTRAAHPRCCGRRSTTARRACCGGVCGGRRECSPQRLAAGLVVELGWLLLDMP
eukprot:250204-Chlamydomonas_euryale.AAC.2